MADLFPLDKRFYAMDPAEVARLFACWWFLFFIILIKLSGLPILLLLLHSFLLAGSY